MSRRTFAGHLRETLEEAGLNFVSLSCEGELIAYYIDRDGVERKELWHCNLGGVPGYAIEYKGKEYEFVREI